MALLLTVPLFGVYVRLLLQALLETAAGEQKLGFRVSYSTQMPDGEPNTFPLHNIPLGAYRATKKPTGVYSPESTPVRTSAPSIGSTAFSKSWCETSVPSGFRTSIIQRPWTAIPSPAVFACGVAASSSFAFVGT